MSEQHNKANGAASLDRIEEICGGDRDLAVELIDTFLKTAAELVERIAKSAGDGERKSVAMDAHTLRGSSSNFDATALQAAAARLEQLAAGLLPGSLSDEVESVRREFDAVRRTLESWPNG